MLLDFQMIIFQTATQAWSFYPHGYFTRFTQIMTIKSVHDESSCKD